jgi:hypothetical protein
VWELSWEPTLLCTPHAGLPCSSRCIWYSGRVVASPGCGNSWSAPAGRPGCPPGQSCQRWPSATSTTAPEMRQKLPQASALSEFMFAQRGPFVLASLSVLTELCQDEMWHCQVCSEQGLGRGRWNRNTRVICGVIGTGGDGFSGEGRQLRMEQLSGTLSYLPTAKGPPPAGSHWLCCHGACSLCLALPRSAPCRRSSMVSFPGSHTLP